MKIFALQKGGPILKTIISRIIEWQGLNPDKTKEDLLAFIENNKEAFLK